MYRCSSQAELNMSPWRSPPLRKAPVYAYAGSGPLSPLWHKKRLGCVNSFSSLLQRQFLMCSQIQVFLSLSKLVHWVCGRSRAYWTSLIFYGNLLNSTLHILVDGLTLYSDATSFFFFFCEYKDGILLSSLLAIKKTPKAPISWTKMQCIQLLLFTK